MELRQWNCDNGSRNLTANGVPDHEAGTFPNSGNPNTIAAVSISEEYSLAPVVTNTASQLGGPRGVTGYILNGVKVDAGTAGSCDDSGQSCSLIASSGSWSIEALGQTSFDFGTDDNNAHVQPTGDYHYHGMPEGFVTKQGGNSSTMTIIGWAADGFPIYARYGYSQFNNPVSTIVAMTKEKMRTCIKYIVLILSILFSQYSDAHVMVAQHGILNFVDDGVYMVLSVPVSAFEGTDDNKDGKLSKGEFDRHQAAIARSVKDKVALSNAIGKLILKGLILSPVTAHDASNNDASQLVIMSRFELKNIDSSLLYQFNLFGNTATEKVIEIAAQHKVKGLKQVIRFTPENTASQTFKN
jgi:hypothetical protein